MKNKGYKIIVLSCGRSVNMTVKVNEIINWFYSDYKDKIVQTHTIQGDTLKEVCGKIYALDRSSRYDNARRYEIVDNDTVKEAYIKYKSNVSIEEYYGGATVD